MKKWAAYEQLVAIEARMSTQPDLFEAYARRTDPGTSHDAAEGIADRLPELEATCLAAIKKAGRRGLTSHELAEATRLDRVTVSPRLRPLANKGLIFDTGTRRAPPGGRPGIVWSSHNPMDDA